MPTLLITGANRGIGLEFTRLFASDGWRVHACCRHPEKAGDLKALNGDIELHRLDVTNGLQVSSLARQLAGEGIDILLNNAGAYGPRSGFGETDFDSWQPVFEVNSFAPLRMAERFVEHVVASDLKQIVNISSQMGSMARNASGGAYIYRASKAALNSLCKSLALDLAAQGITVVMFHPGWVRTDMGGKEADISAAESAVGMRKVIAGLTAADNGRFFNYDGEQIPW